MELIVLTDATVEEFGTPLLKLVFAPLASSGTTSLVLCAPTAGLGTLTANLANAQFHQHGTELLVLLALEEEFTATSPINVNVPVARLSMDSFAPSPAPLDSFTMKQLEDVFALLDKTGTETSVCSVSEVKLGAPH